DGHSLLIGTTNPAVIGWDPAFAYEVSYIIEHGIEEMWGKDKDLIYYISLYNENHPMPEIPKDPKFKEHLLKGVWRHGVTTGPLQEALELLEQHCPDLLEVLAGDIPAELLGTSMLDRKFQALTDRMVHQLSTLSIQPKAKAQPRGKGSGGKRRPRRSGPTLSARPQLGYALATVPRHTMLTRKENFFSHLFLTLPIGGTITAETYYFLFWPHNGVKNMMFF
ncbi:aceE, partial [Symbiodinium sp. KB8]